MKMDVPKFIIDMINRQKKRLGKKTKTKHEKGIKNLRNKEQTKKIEILETSNVFV